MTRRESQQSRCETKLTNAHGAQGTVSQTQRVKLEDTGWNVWRRELEKTSGQILGVWQSGPATKPQIRSNR